MPIFIGVDVFEEDVPVTNGHLGVAETTFPLFFGDESVAILLVSTLTYQVKQLERFVQFVFREEFLFVDGRHKVLCVVHLS